MRSAASCTQPLHESVLPRGARIDRPSVMGAYSWWMGRAAQALIACVGFGCGSRTELDKPAALGDASTPDVTVICPAPAFPSCDAGPAPSEVCAPIHHSASLAESCAL